MRGVQSTFLVLRWRARKNIDENEETEEEKESLEEEDEQEEEVVGDV